MDNLVALRTKYFQETFKHWPLADSDWKGAMERYVLYGISPGGFLEAALANHAYLMAARSHPSNAWSTIMQLLKWISYEAPRECHGNVEKVVEWTKLDAEVRLNICRAKGMIPTDEQITFDTLANTVPA
jgi:hypothetical protein